MIRRTESAARQIDALFAYYEKNEWIEAARHLVDILEKVADELEIDPLLGKLRPDLTSYPYLWIRRDPYFIAYAPPDISDMGPCVVITNIINATWLLPKHVRPLDELVPWIA